MAIKKRKMYKPKQVGPDDINRGMNNLKQDMRSNRTMRQQKPLTQEPKQQPLFHPPNSPQFNVPNYWGQQEDSPRQTTLDEFGLKDENADEPYWTAEQWEEWAYDLLTTVTTEATPRDLLPEWFVTAVDEEN